MCSPRVEGVGVTAFAALQCDTLRGPLRRSTKANLKRSTRLVENLRLSNWKVLVLVLFWAFVLPLLSGK